MRHTSREGRRRRRYDRLRAVNGRRFDLGRGRAAARSGRLGRSPQARTASRVHGLALRLARPDPGGCLFAIPDTPLLGGPAPLTRRRDPAECRPLPAGSRSLERPFQIMKRQETLQKAREGTWPFATPPLDPLVVRKLTMRGFKLGRSRGEAPSSGPLAAGARAPTAPDAVSKWLGLAASRTDRGDGRLRRARSLAARLAAGGFAFPSAKLFTLCP